MNMHENDLKEEGLFDPTTYEERASKVLQIDRQHIKTSLMGAVTYTKVLKCSALALLVELHEFLSCLPEPLCEVQEYKMNKRPSDRSGKPIIVRTPHGKNCIN